MAIENGDVNEAEISLNGMVLVLQSLKSGVGSDGDDSLTHYQEFKKCSLRAKSALQRCAVKPPSEGEAADGLGDTSLWKSLYALFTNSLEE